MIFDQLRFQSGSALPTRRPYRAISSTESADCSRNRSLLLGSALTTRGGKMVELREYMDTALAERVLELPEVERKAEASD